MTLDAPTLLTASVLVACLMAGAHLTVWLQDRRETAILWMVAAPVLGCASGLLRDVLPQQAAIPVVNIVLLTGLACVATAFRALAGRRPSPLLLVGSGALWALACGFPAFWADQNLRVLLASAETGFLMAWAVTELWRDRPDVSAARIGLTCVVGLNGVAALGRGVATLLSPAPPQVGIIRGADLTFVTLWSLGFVLLVGFGLILLVKERALHRFRHAASEDSLTGLANRRRFDAELEAGCVRAARTDRPLSLLMIDVDAFKAYNDACGHPAGDRMLRVVADVLAERATQAGGSAARYGGEEFAILLPDHDAAAALKAANAVRLGVSDLGLPHPGSEHGRLTVSVGLATTGAGPGKQAWDLLREADRGLYAAKRAGRDRVGRAMRVEPTRAAA